MASPMSRLTTRSVDPYSAVPGVANVVCSVLVKLLTSNLPALLAAL